MPLLTIYLYEYGENTTTEAVKAPLQSIELPVSHLFEFRGLVRGKKYELELKSEKAVATISDIAEQQKQNHLASIKIAVDVPLSNKEQSSFARVILPLKNNSKSVNDNKKVLSSSLEVGFD